MKRRLTISIGSNLLRLIVNAITGIYLVRSLTIEEYALYNFLFFTLMSVLVLVDFGVSKALFNRLSTKVQNQTDIKLISISLVVQVFFLTLSLILMSNILDILSDVKLLLLVLFFLFCLLQGRIWNLISLMCESVEKTGLYNLGQTIISILFLLSVILINYKNVVSLELILIFGVIIWLCVSLVTLYKINKFLFFPCDDRKVETFNYYKKYCVPLIPFSMLVFVSDVADRFFLTIWADISDLAIYGVGRQLSALGLTVVTSVVFVGWQKVAFLNEASDLMRRNNLIVSLLLCGFYFSLIYFLFIFFNSKEIVFLLFGEKYLEHHSLISLITICCVFQSVGQITGLVLHALNGTKTFALIGTIGILVNFSLLVIFCSPALNFNIGLIGIVVSFVVASLITIPYTLYYIISKYQLNINLLSHFLIVFASVLLLYFQNTAVSDLSMYSRLLLSSMFCAFLYVSIIYLKVDYSELIKDDA
jgi:O-antigen/teichoic acid export membrane protein